MYIAQANHCVLYLLCICQVSVQPSLTTFLIIPSRKSGVYIVYLCSYYVYIYSELITTTLCVLLLAAYSHVDRYMYASRMYLCDQSGLDCSVR